MNKLVLLLFTPLLMMVACNDENAYEVNTQKSELDLAEYLDEQKIKEAANEQKDIEKVFEDEEGVSSSSNTKDKENAVKEPEDQNVAGSEGEGNTQSPATTPPQPQAKVTILKDTSGMRYITITNDQGNVRAAADLNSAVVFTGNRGDLLDYEGEYVQTADGGTWYKVTTVKGMGYISSVVAKRINDVTVDNSIYVEGTHIRVTGEAGNIRATPNINGQVVYQGVPGEEFWFNNVAYKTSDGRLWYEVDVPSAGIGYISSVVGTVVTYEDSSDYFVITSAGANVRESPSINAAVLYDVGAGTRLEYMNYSVPTSDGRIWHYVFSYGYGYGYISDKVGYFD